MPITKMHHLSTPKNEFIIPALKIDARCPIPDVDAASLTPANPDDLDKKESLVPHLHKYISPGHTFILHCHL